MRRLWRRRKVLRKPLGVLLTEKASRALGLAGEEARAHHHDQISPEHLLLAMVHLDSGIAADALRELGISLHAVGSEVAQHIGHGLHEPVGEIPFDSRTERVLELSRHEAARFGNVHIGTEHLLLGVIREGGGRTSSVLTAFGAGLPQTRQAIIRVLVKDAQQA